MNEETIPQENRPIAAELDRLRKLDVTRNIGDYRVFRSATEIPDRSKMSNKRAMFSTIFPDEAVLVANPTKNFTYFWLYTKGGRYDEELDELYDKGYDPIKDKEKGGKWKVHERFRRTPEGYITWAGHVLYAQTAERFLELLKEEEDERAAMHSIKNVAGSFAEAGRAGRGILNRQGAGAFVKLPGGVTENL